MPTTLGAPLVAEGNLTISLWPTCDCGEIAASQYRVVTDHGPLYFCGHHFRENEAEFMALGYRYLGPRGYDATTAAEKDAEYDDLEDDDD